MEELEYIITDECPEDLVHDAVINDWKQFLEDCHVDFKTQYIVADDELKSYTTVERLKQSVKDCPEVDFVIPQIDMKVRVKRISNEELGNIKLNDYFLP